MKRLAVFASGNGSNFQSIAEAIKSGKLEAEICLVVCDREDAYVLERAKLENIDSFSFSAKNYSNKTEYESEILEKLRQYEIEFIILAGYMRLIGPTLLQKYSQRIVNIHPSLLPSFPGKDAIGQAFGAGVKETGVTVHYVDDGMDTGPVIAQKAVPILEGDTKDILQKRIQEMEHDLYPSVLQELCHKKLT
ncbi:phosphoribosylglycinamide formyltransferase [Peribacillus frigoritolerans]|jgi:phosphoribosylglycinamide formyltransferase-1|uniref:phosphoribosylglycinamide formyltransferase n=1 Tax=Peribacillus frigoritolerans TaxID=450367 RepID=UPI000BBA3567|nr:phosphoribosylglycinamide formyltransferase [Peribacillus frigoritolerans]MBT2604825.1 phosphoribosylglycinamide formyltransferase [Bacillus sp. ISL-53]MCP1491864.1 phosphoribosylglycinamide formyltransferase-1 [Peribacillus frigoritolerans]PCD07658.1 phosphoribosylglycinamide formyltransferase [Peribacillus simplex]